MHQRLRLFLQRLREQLWVKPLLVCFLSIAGVFLAKLADDTGLAKFLPTIELESINTLLSTMSASMLVIATFAVGAMVTAYASASSQATPRSFSLVIADDVSQNALSTFIGSFIYSIVGLIALQNEYFGKAGHFALFALTLAVFALVIITFVRWLDRIARLGRIQTTVESVEAATRKALLRRKQQPRLCGKPVSLEQENMIPFFPRKIGYLQVIEMALLQEYAEKQQLHVRVASLPGVFCTPDRPLAFFRASAADGKPLSSQDLDCDILHKAFVIDRYRTFTDDPRFGLIVLSEIASKALSPGINDPGTAIHVIGAMVRLLTEWSEQQPCDEPLTVTYDRIEVPELSAADMLEDAFAAIGRCGANTVEVAIRLQKGLKSLVCCGDKALAEAAKQQADIALQRAQLALVIDADKEAVCRAAGEG